MKVGRWDVNAPSSEYIDSNDETKQLVNNNNASTYNYKNSLSDTHIIHESACQSINSTSISEASISRIEVILTTVHVPKSTRRSSHRPRTRKI